MSDDEPTLSANWTIKNVPPDVRRRAVEEAQRADQPVAAWLAHAVELAAREAQSLVVLPPERANLPANLPDGADVIDILERLARLAAAAREVDEVSYKRAVQLLRRGLLQANRRANHHG